MVSNRRSTHFSCDRGRASARSAVLQLALGLGVLGLGFGCRSSGNSDTAAASGPGGPIGAKPKADRSDRGSADRSHQSAFEPARREMWFEAQIGRDAVAAREQGDKKLARKLLVSLLADPKSNNHDRAGAHLLLALADLQDGAHPKAARGLAMARKLGVDPVLEAELMRLEAEAHIAAGQPDDALRTLADRRGGSVMAGIEAARIELLRAHAHRLREEDPIAREIYERVIVGEPTGPVQDEARFGLAQLLARSDDPRAKARAEQLLEGLSQTAASKSLRRQAQTFRAGLRPEVQPSAGTKPKQTPSTTKRKSGAADALVASAREALDGRRYTAAVRTVKRLLSKYPRSSAAIVCEARYIQGSAIFKQRERAKSRSAFEAGAKSCKQAGNRKLEVKTRYQAARAIYAQGHYAEAAGAFEALAKDHPASSYWDDALVNAGEAWQSAGKDTEAARVYRKILDDSREGDMQGDARRRLLLMAFVAGRDDEALQLVRSAGKGESLLERAKLAYFEGRVLARMGKPAEAHEAYLRALKIRPLSYPGLQAISRLREAGADQLQAGLSVLASASADLEQEYDLPDSVDAKRARLWAQLGARERAETALKEAGVKGWPAAQLLATAGAWAESQRRIARIPGSWRSVPPVGDHRQAWELAHPLPYFDLVRPRERSRSLPALLTYAIMQTESRFDPRVTSWAGARGLMQLMPATAKELAGKIGLKLGGDSLYRAETNIALGVHYLSNLVERRGGTNVASALAIPSYNAGAGSVARWLRERGDWDFDLFIESIPYDETRSYTQGVLGRWMAYRWLYGEGSPSERVPFLPLDIDGEPAGSQARAQR